MVPPLKGARIVLAVIVVSFAVVPAVALCDSSSWRGNQLETMIVYWATSIVTLGIVVFIGLPTLLILFKAECLNLASLSCGGTAIGLIVAFGISGDSYQADFSSLAWGGFLGLLSAIAFGLIAGVGLTAKSQRKSK